MPLYDSFSEVANHYEKNYLDCIFMLHLWTIDLEYACKPSFFLLEGDHIDVLFNES